MISPVKKKLVITILKIFSSPEIHFHYVLFTRNKNVPLYKPISPN